MTEAAPSPGERIDLSNCDREPIHQLGAIQQQGILLAADPADLRVVQWSDNAPETIGVAADGMAAKSLVDLVDSAAAVVIRRVAEKSVPGAVRTLTVQWKHGRETTQHVAVAHVHQGVLILEVENTEASSQPFIVTARAEEETVPQFLQHASAELQSCDSLEELYQSIARLLRDLSGFDRVMVYRFLEDGHGAVVGESVGEQFESFLGLHYPASDIPPQARRLYELNLLRSIADVNASPVALTPFACPLHGGPLDLTYSVFRSVSPIHIEYLKNMGVAASMSVSILKDGRLWGLIACHHHTPLYLSLELRVACQLFGTMAGTYLTSRTLTEEASRKSARLELISEALQTASEQGSLREGLRDAADLFLRAMDCSGLTIFLGDQTVSAGAVPGESDLKNIRQLPAQVSSPPSWTTDRLPTQIALSPDGVEKASGMAFVRLGTRPDDALFFFRPEYRRTVSWGGDPNKPVQQSSEGMKLSPRRSFTVWKETVQGRSREWSVMDQAILNDLHGGLNTLLARRMIEVERLNRELTRINGDLNTFAYAASHDLREPLRNVHQLIFLLEEDLGNSVTDDLRSRLQSLQRVTGRMDQLIEGLLRISRVGGRDLQIEPVSLQQVVDEAARQATDGHESDGVVAITTSNLPTLLADYMGLREIFINLFTNALKYNRSPRKEVHVSYGLFTEAEGAPASALGKWGVTVRDNGIGIAPTAYATVFEVFRRLHAREYKGVGVGLTIVKKVVERLEGTVWLQSTQGQGTSFHFTVGDLRNVDHHP